MLPSLTAAAIPALAVLIGILIDNQPLKNLSRNFDRGFAKTNRHLDDFKNELMADMLRFERVIDVRLKHLEAHL